MAPTNFDDSTVDKNSYIFNILLILIELWLNLWIMFETNMEKIMDLIKLSVLDSAIECVESKYKRCFTDKAMESSIKKMKAFCMDANLKNGESADFYLFV